MEPSKQRQPNNRLYLGTMSGTSLDGIDLALLSFESTDAATARFSLNPHTHLPQDHSHQSQNHQSIQLLGHKTVPYSQLIWQKMQKLRENYLHYAEIGELEQMFTTETALAINQWLEELRHCDKCTQWLNLNGLPHPIDASKIAAIGFHGHTLWHQPHQPTSNDRQTLSDKQSPSDQQRLCPQRQRAFSWQMGCPSTLARLTNISVVHDFRSADIAHGGQGAPLAPAFHQALFGGREALSINQVQQSFLNPQKSQRNRQSAYFNSEVSQVMVLNLGGFANLTLLDRDDQKVLAGDTGPANCLIDAWYCHHHNRQKGVNNSLRYDHNGNWGRTGVVQTGLLEALLDHPFFGQSFPKSTGFEQFNLSWLTDTLAKCQPAHASGYIPPEDVQCTLHHFTAETIAHSIKQSKQPQPNSDPNQNSIPEQDAQVGRNSQQGNIIVCGGGVHNGFLMELIRQRLGHHFEVISSDALGFASDAIEASAFAWLAWRFIQGLPGNLVNVTGANQPLCLGSWTPAPGRGFWIQPQ